MAANTKSFAQTTRLALALTLGVALFATPPARAQFGESQANYQTALEFYRLGEWLTAERILLEILNRDPGHHQARWTLANLYLRIGRADAASPQMRAVAQGEGGELARQAQAWLDANAEATKAPAAFTPDASGSISLEEVENGYQWAAFPTAPLHLRIPADYSLQGTEIRRQGDQIRARYVFAPDAASAERLGVSVELTTLERGIDPGNHRVVLVREMLSRDGLSQNTPFREEDQLVHGNLARYMGYRDPAAPNVQILALGVANARYRVILRAACPASLAAEHLPKIQTMLGSLRLR